MEHGSICLHRARKACLLIIAALALAGCASLSPDAGFNKVRSDQKPGDYTDPGWYEHPRGTLAYETS